MARAAFGPPVFRSAPAASGRVSECALSIASRLYLIHPPPSFNSGVSLPAMTDRFEKRLENGPPVVTDGGMGVLVSSAVPGLRCPEEANVRAPESVISLHTSFIAAGAELIETNTFGANRHKLRARFLEDELAAINEAAETFGGVSARKAVERLADYDLAAVGANHGAGLHAALAALEAMGNGRPLAALPNVGLASLSGGRIIYPHATPEYFAEFAAQARALGARVIGGCCGTTPIEIAAIARAVEEERQPTAPFATAEREIVVAAHERPEETELAKKLRTGEWVTCVELDPPKGGTYDAMLAVTRALKDSGRVGFVDINDNPMARARANALMAAIAIERSCGIETIPHVTPRDTSVMGLQSQLLAAHAEGVRNVLSVTGDPPHVGDYPGSRGVYEVDSIGLSQMVTRLNSGEDFNGKAIDAPTSFFLGVAVNPSADDLDTELDRFRRKVESGAQFAMTQALFDLSYLDRFEERLGGWPIPVLLGIFIVRSHQLAVRLHNEVPGIVVPEGVQRRLERAGANAAAEGLALARELCAEAREKAAGVYIIPPFKQPEAALDVLVS